MAIIKVSLSGSLSDSIGSTSARRWSDVFNGGVELPAGRISFADGSDVGEVNRIAVIDFSILTTATLTINLQSGQTDVLGRSLVLTKLKFVYMELDAANTGDIYFGPQNVADSAELWFDGVDAGARMRVKQHMLISDPTGYTIDATHKNISITNSTLATIDGKLVLGGVA